MNRSPPQTAPMWVILPVLQGQAAPTVASLSMCIPRGHRLFLGIHLLWCGAHPRAVHRSLHPHGSTGCRGTGASASAWSALWAAGESQLPLLLLHLVPTGLFPLACSHVVVVLFALPEYVVTEVLPPFLKCPALSGGTSITGATSNWFYRTQRKILAVSHRSHSCTPPTTKAWPCKPNILMKRRKCIFQHF